MSELILKTALSARSSDTIRDCASLLPTLSEIYGNAHECFQNKTIVDCALQEKLADISSSIFSLLDRSEVLEKRIARNTWRLRSTLSFTLLDYDDPRLKLGELLETLNRDSVHVPQVHSLVLKASDITSKLISNGRNPKREAISELIAKLEGDHRCGIFAAACGPGTPGWPADADASIVDLGLQPLRSRRDFVHTVFDCIIIPGNTRFASPRTLLAILYGGRSKKIELITYRSENAFLPEKPTLPSRSVYFRAKAQTVQEQNPSTEIRMVQAPLDQWIHDSYWEAIRKSQGDLSPSSDRDTMTAGRFVVFADGSGAYLPDKGSAVVIPEDFASAENRSSPDVRLPRKAVQDLEEGDLVMLRLRGSGDYLSAVADMHMERDGKAQLRNDALEWKDHLYTAIKRHGEGTVAKVLRDEGFKLRSPQYLWNWAGDEVMAPDEFETFQKLLRAVSRLQSTPRDEAVDDWSTRSWQQMDEVRSYRHKASLTIRTALIERVRNKVTAGGRIETVLTIDLPGVQAGSMGLLRVGAVDSKTYRIPASRMSQLAKTGVD